MTAYKHLLSAGQKKDILNALQSGGQLVIKPTRTQQGGFLGTLLASIGVPLLLNALTGKGIQADKTGTANTVSVYVPDNTTQKQSLQLNPNSRNNTIKFINKPLSDIDLLHWVKQLGIKYFRGIYSRDNLPEKIHKLETGII